MNVETLRDGRQRTKIQGEWVYSPPVPRRREQFLNGDVPKRKDQKWERDYPGEAEISLLSDAERTELLERELDRRENGCWFYNDGQPTYLTGNHYNYLTHTILPSGGYPTFYDSDQKFYWWWDLYVVPDNQCCGGVSAGPRQKGKTAKGCEIILNDASLTPNVHNGIQSKTDSDARDAFRDFVVTAWRNMSALIRPKTSLASDDPKTELAFRAPTRKGAKAAGPVAVALNSRINFKPSKENSYDGRTMHRYFMDEPFKEQDYDSEERRKIVSRMMWRHGVAIGKMLLASSVDEQEAFDPKTAEKIWSEANPAERSATGRTKNGLVRFFISAQECHLFDEFGRARVADSLADIEANAPADPVARRAYFRANPRTEADMFATGNKDSIFNLENLDAAKDNNRQRIEKTGKPYWRQVDLVWADDERTKVKTSDNDVNGRFKIIFGALPTEQNNVRVAGTHYGPFGTVPRYQPMNRAEYAAGCDPYDARTVRDMGAASKGAAYVFWKPDELHERERFDHYGTEKPAYWPSDSFIVEYVNRPPRPVDFYEDMIKMCHFFGCPFLPENNKPGVIAYFEDRGYGDFIAGKINIIDSKDKKTTKKRNDTPGMAASVSATDQWSERLSDFTHGPLGDDPRRMPFQHQIQDVITLDITKTKANDAGVATGWTLLLARQRTRKPQTLLQRAQMAVSELFAFDP